MNEENNNVNEVKEPVSEATEIIDVVETPVDDNIQNDNVEITLGDKPKKKKTGLILVILILLICAGGAGYFLLNDKKEEKKVEKKTETNTKEVEASYKITDYKLSDFDLLFIKENNDQTNKVCSPLSVKYTLEMLSEGATGESKTQIDNVIGEYSAKKYTNSANMSFANALFIKDSLKNDIKSNYTNTLKTKYNAEVMYDSFNDAKNINTWVYNNTNKLIKDLASDEDVKEQDFILLNALSINMEWINKIQPTTYVEESPDKFGEFDAEFAHEKIGYFGVSSLDIEEYRPLKFNNKKNVDSLRFGVIANKYDIVKELGAEKIRKTVEDDIKKMEKTGGVTPEEPVKEYLDQYMKDIAANYKYYRASTDFKYYDDNDVKVFAKDLKTYNGVTLQYIAILPKKVSLNDYIKNVNATELNTTINNLKDIKYDDFEEGVITAIHGFVPLYKFDYMLDLKPSLNKMGITNVYDQAKANLTNIMDQNAHIKITKQKATIEFSNEGIKAAAATEVGGAGGLSGGYDYLFDVPIKFIDLTFDKPFMYIIRDKDSGEVWFTGTVYEPTPSIVTDYSVDPSDYDPSKFDEE